MPRQSDTRDKLIESAVALIHARSYSGVGVQEICELAGVRKGSFYHFFPSKRDLTLATMDELAQRARADIFDPAFDPVLPPLRRIERLFEVMYEVQKKLCAGDGQVLGCFFGNLALEMSTQDELLRGRLDGIFHLVERRIAGVLAEAKADGSAPDLDVPAAAQVLFALLEGALLVAKTRNDLEPLRRAGAGAVALVLSFKKGGGGGD